MASLLIVDDDIELCTMLRDYFHSQEMSLAMCHDGQLGLETALAGRFDVVILDVMLPSLGGFEVLRQLRAATEVGILMLSSRDEDDSLVFGLENGADDYVPKPFNPRELLARIRSVLRRRSQRQAAVQAAVPLEHPPSRLEHSGFVLYPGSRRAFYRETPLQLSSVEFQLLEALLSAPGKVLSRDCLAESIFSRAYNPLDRSLDMLVSRLRRKLELSDNPGARIRTIRNEGYLFADLPDMGTIPAPAASHS